MSSTTASDSEVIEVVEQVVHPSFDYDDADVTLRSSDKVDFHVHKIILSLSSPFFKSMFLLKQPNESSSEKHRPVVDMSEGCTTIEALLAFIYPRPTVLSDAPKFDSLDEIMDVLACYVTVGTFTQRGLMW
jgi:hypothetical protein